MVNCSNCKREVSPTALFPNDICVDCYALTEEANRPITGEELARMWGGKQVNGVLSSLLLRQGRGRATLKL